MARAGAQGRPFYSGTQRVTGYMVAIAEILDGVARSAGRPIRVLDMPAGHGQFTDLLRDRGHLVVSADINGRRPDYVFADMNASLPFDDGAFDAVVCMEGIEHVLDAVQLIAELIRIARPGGRIVISTPNITSFHSRMQFLLTGTFYQFSPADFRDLPPGAEEDRGHISPMTYTQVRYFANLHGADMVAVLGDRWKRKVLLPLYLLLHACGRPWSWRLFHAAPNEPWRARNRQMAAHMTSPALLFARSAIYVLAKREPDRKSPVAATSD
ncbi:MAG: class I SAM-dependent methyltransferase [Phycisphaerales bacterium]|nr:class I SAM-dependent methyltransferase [Phycisphaerales bacterium]